MLLVERLRDADVFSAGERAVSGPRTDESRARRADVRKLSSTGPGHAPLTAAGERALRARDATGSGRLRRSERSERRLSELPRAAVRSPSSVAVRGATLRRRAQSDRTANV